LAIGRCIRLHVSFRHRISCLLERFLRRSTGFGGIVENGRSGGIGLVRRFLKLLFVRLTAGNEQRGNGEDDRKTHRDLGFGFPMPMDMPQRGSANFLQLPLHKAENRIISASSNK
jgi:hypothetical protein